LSAEPAHLKFIDASRGVAFLGVLSVHVSYAVGPFPRRALFLHGGLGVTLFFIVSAYTLCHSHFRRQGKDPHPLRAFYVRRLARIAPMYWLAILLYALGPQLLPAPWLNDFAPEGHRPADYVANVLFLHGWRPNALNSVVPGGWSIAVEMMFYAAFPLLLRWASDARRAALALLGALALRQLATSDWLVAGLSRAEHFPADAVRVFCLLWPPAQLFVFLAGVLLYHLAHQAAFRSWLSHRPTAVVLLAFGLLALASFLEGNTTIVDLYVWQALALACIVLALSGGALDFLLWKPLQHVGRLSYSCYLLHFIFAAAGLKLFGVHPTSDRPSVDLGSPQRNLLAFAGAALLGVAGTVVAASLTERFVEKPGIALGRKVIARLNRTRAAPAG